MNDSDFAEELSAVPMGIETSRTLNRKSAYL